jgi:hypothetical protein
MLCRNIKIKKLLRKKIKTRKEITFQIMFFSLVGYKCGIIKYSIIYNIISSMGNKRLSDLMVIAVEGMKMLTK